MLLILLLGLSGRAHPAGAVSAYSRANFPYPARALAAQSAATKSGVSLGGIGCGTLDLLPTGRFTNATINNNWEQPIRDLDGCFAAVWSRAGGRSTAHVFSTDPPRGLPGVPALEFDGYFPRALLRETDPRQPVRVSLQAFSSFIPQDLKNSSIPAALLVFTVRNESNGPVEASIAVSWENVLGRGGTLAKGAFADRSGNSVQEMPAVAGIFGLRMASPDRQVVDPPHRLIYNARGSYALLAAPTTPETVVTTAGWNARSDQPEWWRQFSESGTVDGSVSPGQEGRIHPAGVVAMKVSLREKESIELPFAVAWHTPRLYTLDGAEYGHFYEASFEDAVEVGRYALENRQSHLALLDEWQNRILRSTLPDRLARRVISSASVLFTNTILTRSSGSGGEDPGPSRFAFFDITEKGKAELVALEQRRLAHAVALTWFPELDFRELNEVLAQREPTGALPRSLGDLERGITVDPTMLSSDPSIIASHLFQVASRFRWTGDQPFLDRFYPSVKYAVEATAGRIAEAVSSATPAERQRSQIQWLIALLAARDMAQAMADRRFVERCEDLLRDAERGVGDVADSDLVSIAAPAVWMADLLQLNSPTLDALRGQLSTYLCQAPRTAPDGRPADITNQTFGGGTAGRRAALDAGMLASAAVAGTMPACAMSWALGIDRWLDSPSAYERPLSAASAWHNYLALAGIRLDLPAAKLTLAPVLPPKARTLTMPVFAPTFWARLEFRATLTSARLTFRLERMMPARPPQKIAASDRESPIESSSGLLIKQVVLPSQPDRVTTEVTASVGRAPAPGTFQRLVDGRIAFTFDSPLSITVGQTIAFQLR